jgi:serine/threonine-protein kinase PknK
MLLRLGPELGRGEGARVVSSELSGGQLVALKIAHPGRERFLLKEARALALAAGEHAPRLLGVGRVGADSELALVMERAPGCSLRELLERGEEGEDRRGLSVAVLVQVSTLLQRLHALGLSHGDIKPDNLMVTLDPRPYVTVIDFGLSGDSPFVQGGTPRYLPPEALSGATVRSQMADAYGLALTLVEILVPSFRQVSPAEMELDRLGEDFRALFEPYLAPRHGVRPALAFMVEEARNRGLSPRTPEFAEVRAAIRREYLATRLHELDLTESPEILVEGDPGTWLRNTRELLVSIREEELNLEPSTGTVQVRSQERDGAASPPLPLKELTAYDRKRFLGRLIGPVAANWKLEGMTDHELSERLAQRGQEKGLRSLIAADLSPALDSLSAALTRAGADALLHAALGDERGTHERAPLNSVSWALALGRRPVRRALLEGISHAQEVPEPVVLEAARAARQIGDLSLAQRILGGRGGDAISLQRAHLLLRAGARDEGLSIAERLSNESADPLLRARAQALCARNLVDGGDSEGALSLLSESVICPEVLEVRALACLSVERADEALAILEVGDSLSTTEEESARLQGVRGMVLHSQGLPLEALRSFERACELASRAGAALEEATYSTGVAAAASDAGYLSQALSASERAGLLFESLGHGAQNARALLARASVLASLRIPFELGAVVRRGLSLARQSGDTLCEAYLLLALCDGVADAETRRRSASRAAELLSGAAQEPRLRAAARVLVSKGRVDEPGDEWVQAGVQMETRLDWWRARAEVLERASSHAPGSVTWASAQSVVSALKELAANAPQLSSSGPAFVAGAHLALRVGMAEDAKRLLSQASTSATHFLRHIPINYRAQADELLWIQQARGTRMGTETGAEQLGDVDGLLRALSQRQGFGSLLNQVLDMLLLWTGVERGLLLLRAPGERLVVRAARNIERKALSPEQRTLSLSMAKRALSEGRPVVAVDAMQDMSSLHKSVHALNLRSVLAVPLSARGEVLGVAYLDDRVRRGAFGERELSWVGLIGTVAALAIADERDRLDLRRALRRARRAEQRLEQKLYNQEAELERAERELSRMREERELRGDYSRIIGKGSAMSALLKIVDRVAFSEIPALILGESGTGKELIARAIASTGTRKKGPFIAENCGAVPEGLAESTFFGHIKGAFTGASKDQPGLFELADGGTLFLDEIGEMSLTLQTKLLRVLQEGEVRPLGASRSKKVDVRMLVATHQDLRRLVEEGRFREDLYYRLNVVSLNVPSLRERPEDVAPLVHHFLAQHSGDRKRTVSDAAMRRLSSYSWPGNVRQLENEVRRMLILGEQEISTADLSSEVMQDSDESREAKTLKEKVDALERRLLVEALEQARGNRSKAAELLGLSRFGLQKMSQRLEVVVAKNPPKAGRIRDRRLDESG